MEEGKKEKTFNKFFTEFNIKTILNKSNDVVLHYREELETLKEKNELSTILM